MTADDQAAQDDLWAWMQPPVDEARRLRDQGTETALNAADSRARGAAEEALRDLARSGVEFSSDDLHERVGSPLACSGAVMGALFLAAAKRGEIEHVGHTRSKRPSSHGREVRTWRGTRGAAPDRTAPGDSRGSAPSTQTDFPHRPVERGAGTWTAADEPKPCVDCRAPAFMRDPEGRPRHKAECRAS